MTSPLTFFAVPSNSGRILSRDSPRSSEMTCVNYWVRKWKRDTNITTCCFWELTSAPVRTARSSKLAFLLSPNPGALIAHTLSPAWCLLRISIANASLSTSSATIRSGLLLCKTTIKKKWVISLISNYVHLTSEHNIIHKQGNTLLAQLLQELSTKSACLTPSSHEWGWWDFQAPKKQP